MEGADRTRSPVRAVVRKASRRGSGLAGPCRVEGIQRGHWLRALRPGGLGMGGATWERCVQRATGRGRRLSGWPRAEVSGDVGRAGVTLDRSVSQSRFD